MICLLQIWLWMNVYTINKRKTIKLSPQVLPSYTHHLPWHNHVFLVSRKIYRYNKIYFMMFMAWQAYFVKNFACSDTRLKELIYMMMMNRTFQWRLHHIIGNYGGDLLWLKHFGSALRRIFWCLIWLITRFNRNISMNTISWMFP